MEPTNEELCVMVQAGMRAEELLIARNTPFARSKVKQFSVSAFDREELASAALKGLMEAGRKWRAEDGATFLTFARWSIRTNVARWIDLQRNIRTKAEDGKEVRYSPRTVELHENLEHPQPHATEHGSIAEYVDRKATMLTILGDAISDESLPKRQVQVLLWRMAELTLQDCASRLGNITRERVRQIETKAIEAVRRIVAAKEHQPKRARCNH